MQPLKIRTKVFLAIAASSTLFACGGGGSGTATTDNSGGTGGTGVTNTVIDGAWIGDMVTITNTTYPSLTLVSKAGDYVNFSGSDSTGKYSSWVTYGGKITTTGNSFTTTEVLGLGLTSLIGAAQYPYKNLTGTTNGKASFTANISMGNVSNSLTKFASITGTTRLSGYDNVVTLSNLVGSYSGTTRSLFGQDSGSITIDSTGKFTHIFSLFNCELVGQITVDTTRNLHNVAISKSTCDASLVGSTGMLSIFTFPNDTKDSLIFFTKAPNNTNNTVDKALSILGRKV
jgi:hypothetical protein